MASESTTTTESSAPAGQSTASATEARAPSKEVLPIHDWIYHTMLWLYSVFFWFGRWERHGLENVPRTGPIIIAPNHISMFDPPLVGCATPRLVTTMGKSELFEKRTFGLKILGFIIQHMATFPVNRGSGDRRALRRAMQILKDGGALVIFPEGTRSADGQLGAPELGLAMIAHSTKAPIVPVFLQGTEGSLSKMQPRFRRIKVRIYYGEPLTFDKEYAAKGDRATLTAISERVMTEIGALRAAAPPLSAPARKAK